MSTRSNERITTSWSSIVLLLLCFGDIFPTSSARRLNEEVAIKINIESTDAVADPAPCPKITVDPSFDSEKLYEYTSGKWYVHEQAITTYLPQSNNYCVTAQYRPLTSTTFWGYSIEVNNTAKNIDGDVFGGILYAAQTNPEEEPAKLEVAPGFLPRLLAGPYWILKYQEEIPANSDENYPDGLDEYALIIGGQPTFRSAEGGCRTRNRVINSSGGLWIFTRKAERNEKLVGEIIEEAQSAYDLDTSVLNRVYQNGAVLDDGTTLVCMY